MELYLQEKVYYYSENGKLHQIQVKAFITNREQGAKIEMDILALSLGVNFIKEDLNPVVYNQNLKILDEKIKEYIVMYLRTSF